MHYHNTLFHQLEWWTSWLLQSHQGHTPGWSIVTLPICPSNGGLGGILYAETQSPSLKYHWRCKENTITHLCFVDDLIVFRHANTTSVGILKSSLDKFSTLSGHMINLSKSFIYLSGIDRDLQSTIQDQVGFDQRAFPVRYLGVPLITIRLTHTDCLPLVDRIIARIKLWTSSSLTYAVQIQLIKSVLFSIQVYWSTMSILPCSTIKKIKSILAAFLWKRDFTRIYWS